MSAKRVDIVKIKMVKERSELYECRKFKNPVDIYGFLTKYLDESDKEIFGVICLNTKNEPINISTVSIGTINNSLAHPREVFKTAILSNSNKILIFHNHPSGNIEPSNEDNKITKRLVAAGEILGIEVLDHIIVGDYEFYSFKENLKI